MSASLRRRAFVGLAVALASIAGLGAWLRLRPLRDPPPLDPALERTVTAWLAGHAEDPVDYVVDRLRDHDVVFLGEFHRIRHDVRFVQALVPRLYAAGVRHLGFEFGGVETQALVDSLLVAPEYDADAVRRVLFEHDPFWGYVEYEDVYRAAWRVNRARPPGAPPFRIVHLDYRPRWELRQGPLDDATRRRIWYRGDRDVFMARTLMREIVARGRRALVYCGINHAFTRFEQPFYDRRSGRCAGTGAGRMGNIVRRAIGKRAMTIALHQPWASRRDGLVHPVGGAVDRAMDVLGNPRAGFDVVGSPLAALRDTVAAYAACDSAFTLGSLCDGYVYLAPLREFGGCTVDGGFLGPGDLESARARCPTDLGRRILRWRWVWRLSLWVDAQQVVHRRLR